MDNVLIIQFAKAPILGCVKTRMQPVLSKDESLELHEYLVKKTFFQLVKNPVGDIALFSSNKGTFSLFEELKLKHPEVDHQLQVGTDLGARLLNAFIYGLKKYKQVIIIGSDCPFIDSKYLSLSIDQLQSGNNVVLGPAKDGGYVLIGLSGKVSASLFDDIRWGTEFVFDQTRSKVHQLGWKLSILPVLSDIDRPEDLKLLEDYPDR